MTWVLAALFALAWQTATAGEDLRGRPGVRPIGPNQLPAITINNPAASTIETSDQHMTLQGSASSPAGVSVVSWRSNRGPSGIAKGTVSWEAGPVPLELGANTITVTVSDLAGNSASDAITIYRESQGQQSATLSWVAPTQRVDGTPLTNLAGYRIHYGRMSRTYDYEIRISNPGVLSYVIQNLSPGLWYFSMTALDSNGVESGFSNETTRLIE